MKNDREVNVSSIIKVGLAADLEARAKAEGDLIVGLAGAGQMGTDIVVELSLMPGVRLGAVSEVRDNAAREAVLMSGRDQGDIVPASSGPAVDRAIEAGKVAVTDDYHALCSSGRINVIIDATGNPNIGTLLALDAMKNGKHIVMLNVEADITIGRFLKEEARKAGVIYTGAAGDEPAATVELIGFAQALGFEIVAAGKGKNNPLKFDATPDAFEKEARERNMNPRMLVEFVDGSKTMIEMTAVANATGLEPDVPGMHGPKATKEELGQVLCTKADGGILNNSGVVDYSIGKGVAPGVFCVVKPRHPRVLERMIDLKVGPGPCFGLVRPYHLTSLEVPLSAIRAARYRAPDLVPIDRPVGECGAVAKRDLAPGHVLDKIGEYDYRGHAMKWLDARNSGAMPLGIAEGSKVLKPIKAGEKLTYENCSPDDSMVVTQIRRRLDQSDAQFVNA